MIPNRVFLIRLIVGLAYAACLSAGIAAGLWLRPPAATASQLDQRRDEIQKMNSAEKDRLRRDQDRFASASPDQKQRLRELHRQLASADDADELRGTMSRYHAWLKTLSPTDRAELLQHVDDPKKRIVHVKEMIPLSEDDWIIVNAWLSNLIKVRRPEIRFSSRDRLKFALLYDGRSSRLPPGRQPLKPITAQEFSDLAQKLPKVPKSVLEAQDSDADKRRRIARWARQRRGQRYRNFSHSSKTTEDVLLQFFNTLAEEERRQLLEIPLSIRSEKLREKYRKAHPSNGPKRPSISPNGRPPFPRRKDFGGAKRQRGHEKGRSRTKTERDAPRT